jgi:hypothetical protein
MAGEIKRTKNWPMLYSATVQRRLAYVVRGSHQRYEEITLNEFFPATTCIERHLCATNKRSALLGCRSNRFVDASNRKS